MIEKEIQERIDRALEACEIIKYYAECVYMDEGFSDWGMTRKRLFDLSIEILTLCDDAYVHKNRIVDIAFEAIETIKQLNEHSDVLQLEKGDGGVSGGRRRLDLHGRRTRKNETTCD